MKKFLQFIWVLIEPIVTNILMGIAAFLAFGWALSFFGLMFLFMPETPIWFKGVIIILDSLILFGIIYGAIIDAYEKVYKK